MKYIFQSTCHVRVGLLPSPTNISQGQYNLQSISKDSNRNQFGMSCENQLIAFTDNHITGTKSVYRAFKKKAKKLISIAQE